jgi:signal transduction histidine kinase
VRASSRARPLSTGVEAALAFLLAAGSFALVAVTVVAAASDLPIALLTAVYVVGVVLAFRLLGVAYGIPVGVALLIAIDWYWVPPVHPASFPDAGNLADVVAYLAAGVLIGAVAARAGRRAEASELGRSELAGEQAALRRVATLVAGGEPPDAVFAAVAKEAGAMLELDGARVIRFVGEDEVLQLEGWTAPGLEPLPVGPRKLENTSLATEVMRTGQAVRIDDYASVKRVIPGVVERFGIRAGVAAPIYVDGQLWGAMLAWSVRPRLLSEDADGRLADFTELVGMAISNASSREELALLVREQEALRRVATLVARGVSRQRLFATVCEEVGLLLDVDATFMGRYESDETSIGVGGWSLAGEELPLGTRARLDGENVTARVFRTGRPARLDDYDEASGEVASITRPLGIRSAVGAPIVVDGRPWGAMVATSVTNDPLPAGTEARIAAFTELVATAISNSEARAEIGRLADEQAALRRVATLVARGSPATEVFAVVAREVGELLGAESAWMHRYEDESSATVVATWGPGGSQLSVGSRFSLEGDSVVALVLRTGRLARFDFDDYSHAAGETGEIARDLGLRSAVGSPIKVGGRLWGAMTAVTSQGEPLPADAGPRIDEFTELVATAIANTEARSELAASRARIVAATDEERRRVVRDLHDGAQQRLVHTVVTLKLARRALETDRDEAPVLLTEALRHAEEATAELRELAHGILPSVLTQGGLRAGVVALASRMPVPVDVGVSVQRLPSAVEATAYFIVAESLTNVAKHAHARHAQVTARVTDGALQVQVRDDGVGGARSDGSGLLGLADRLGVLDGRLRVDSPADGGTLVAAVIPLR